MIPPSSIGLPPKFSSWYPGQWETIESIFESGQRFSICPARTGTGKSAIAMALALMSGGRTVYLTSTKGLQTQLRNDFAETGLRDVRGRANYRCHMGRKYSCEDGTDLGCKAPRCPYKEAKIEFLRSPLGCTNYDYWILANRFGDGLGKPDLLVLDEGHAAADHVSKCMSVPIKRTDILRLAPVTFPSTLGFGEWQTWAGFVHGEAESVRATLVQLASSHHGNLSDGQLELLKLARSTVRKMTILMEGFGVWVVQTTKSGWRLDPIWPAPYSESSLFLGIKKIIVMSATFIQKSRRILGVSQEEAEWHYTPDTFPAKRCPVYFYPIVKMNWKVSKEDFSKMVGVMDQILLARRDRKGLLLPVSYRRRNEILETAADRSFMWTNNTDNTAERVAQFKLAVPPACFISPSLGTGYDLPGQECEYIILPKLPYPDESDKLTKARINSDGDYRDFVMNERLQQYAGRGMRGRVSRKGWDQCEVFILDALFTWSRRRRYLANWFKRLIRTVGDLPEPLPSLASQNGKLDR